MAGFHDTCSWIDIGIIGIFVIKYFYYDGVGPDLTCILKTNDVREITISWLQLV